MQRLNFLWYFFFVTVAVAVVVVCVPCYNILKSLLKTNQMCFGLKAVLQLSMKFYISHPPHHRRRQRRCRRRHQRATM